jgi:hypothetical protein
MCFIKSYVWHFAIFQIDDSGSMCINDGNHLVKSGKSVKTVSCTRWQELMDCMRFHTKLAEVSGSMTEFRLLNGAPPVVVGTPDGGVGYSKMQQIMDRSPGGGTPLCRHIREVCERIREIEPQLRANGHKAVVVIATDGESSDGNIVEAMKPLHNLPAWVVIRLCTDDDKVVDYWNNIDSQLELEMDILDDLFGEAAEVHGANKWLTYAEPMHRLREWGVHLRELDLIDEGKLAMNQMHTIANILSPVSEGNLPNPEIDFEEFIRAVKVSQASDKKVLNPQTMKYEHWLRVDKLKSMYGPGGCTIA